jgi:hypothetical protein
MACVATDIARSTCRLATVAATMDTMIWVAAAMAIKRTTIAMTNSTSVKPSSLVGLERAELTLGHL